MRHERVTFSCDLDGVEPEPGQKGTAAVSAAQMTVKVYNEAGVCVMVHETRSDLTVAEVLWRASVAEESSRLNLNNDAYWAEIRACLGRGLPNWMSLFGYGAFTRRGLDHAVTIARSR